MKKKVKDVMTAKVEVASPSTTIQEIAKKMKTLNVGCIPICENQKVLGIVTDRDIAIRAVALGCDPIQTTASSVLTAPIIHCFDDQDIYEAAEIMEKNQIRRLIILDRNKKMVGIASLGDLAVKTQKDELVGEILERVSEPTERHAAFH